MFTALNFDSITLKLIDENNLSQVLSMFKGFPDSDAMIQEIQENYIPEYENGQRIKYGFYTIVENQLAGLSLLGISDRKTKKGYTGADTLLHMRGQGIAPRSKPHLFYLGFEMLGLNRLETGCLVSNIASKRSIEKTPGFIFEGVSRESGLNDAGQFEDEYLYAILKKDWQRLYAGLKVEVIN